MEISSNAQSERMFQLTVRVANKMGVSIDSSGTDLHDSKWLSSSECDERSHRARRLVSLYLALRNRILVPRVSVRKVQTIRPVREMAGSNMNSASTLQDDS